MADSEPLIERLAAENHEFRKLREEHKKYEEELAELGVLCGQTLDNRFQIGHRGLLVR